MSESSQSSRRRYLEYRRRRREREPNPEPHALRHSTKRSRSFRALYREFWRLLRGRRGTVFAALATLTVATGLGLLSPAGTKIAIDYVITDSPGPAGLPGPWRVEAATGRQRVGLLLTLASALIGVAVLKTAVGMWGRWQMTRLTKQVQSMIRRRVFAHAVQLPLHRVYRLKSGGVSSILRDDAGGAGDLLFRMIYNPWQAVGQLTGTLVILGWVDWRMLLGALVLIPTVWLTHQTWIARIRPVQKDIRATRQGIDAHATESFGGMRIVRGFARHRGEGRRFAVGTHYMARQEILSWWWARVVDIAWAMIIPLASVGVLVYGGWRVIQGALTIGDVMMFTAYLFMLLSPLEILAVSATEMQTNLAGFDRVLDLLAEPTEFAHLKGNRRPDPARTRARVSIEGVWFTYPAAERRGEPAAPVAARKPVVRGVSLEVAPGETIALIGPSGAGKTTLCNLVARFYDPDGGRILLDGVDLREFEPAAYRRLLGIVEQDVFLFDGTVAENIGYARRGATVEQVRAAAAAANAAGFVERLEQGYDTLIGERGVRLSGGQKQRLAIARAVLADPRILILDEATSNLDTESERLIQESLGRLMKGRTCFVIAHRLSTIRHADRIAVMEDGEIVEIGPHRELLAAGGRYAELLHLQLDQGAPGPALPLREAAALPRSPK